MCGACHCSHPIHPANQFARDQPNRVDDNKGEQNISKSITRSTRGGERRSRNGESAGGVNKEGQGEEVGHGREAGDGDFRVDYYKDRCFVGFGVWGGGIEDYC